jgi:hypothetical protein
MGTLLNDCDQCLFDSIASEVNRLAGTTCTIYLLDQEGSARDPLYDEPIDSAFVKNDDGTYGVECPVFFKSPDRNATSGEEGYRLDRISDLSFAAVDLRNRDIERRLRLGDIIKVWGKYYDVLDSHRGEGHLNDSGEVSSTLKVDVNRRTKAPPEELYLEGIVEE